MGREGREFTRSGTSVQAATQQKLTVELKVQRLYAPGDGIEVSGFRPAGKGKGALENKISKYVTCPHFSSLPHWPVECLLHVKSEGSLRSKNMHFGITLTLTGHLTLTKVVTQQFQ